MSARIYNSPFPSITPVSTSLFSFLFSGKHDPNRPAFTDGLTGRTLTHAQIRTAALRFAHGARSQLGLKQREVALVFSPNSIEWPVVLLGIIAAGSVATLANAVYTPTELAHQYTDSGARLLFVHPALLPAAKAMFAHLGVSEQEAERRLVVMQFGARKGAHGNIVGLEDLLDKGTLDKEVAFDGDAAHETAVMCYSSGTTGKPKGVETTHRNITAQLQMLFSICDYVQEDVFTGILPFFHIYGLVVLVLNTIMVGAQIIVLPQFVPDVFFSSIPKYRVTRAFIVPPVALAFVHHPAAVSNDLRSLQTIFSGAAPFSSELIKALAERLKSLGAPDVVIAQGYGMTELSPVCHYVTPEQARRGKSATVGQLLPNLEARLVASDDDAIVDAESGQPGELWIRGPTVMKRYLNNKRATDETLTRDGWLKTGDVAIMDSEGFFSIVDRKKELIKYKGFQVSPAELEDILLGHPDVVDTAVIGVLDVLSGSELPRAYVVRRPGGKKSDDVLAKEIAGYIESRVAKHKKLLGGVGFINEIPKSASGKILRRELRERAAKELSTSNTSTQVKSKL